MIKAFICTAVANLAFVLAFVAAPALSKDRAPMPQTRGMQGMNPALHDQPAADPYEGCIPNPEKAAQQAKHPMPDTRGMQGMDPKAHVMDCPEGSARKEPAQPTHVHKTPAG
jgi:hypothetical protein